MHINIEYMDHTVCCDVAGTQVRNACACFKICRVSGTSQAVACILSGVRKSILCCIIRHLRQAELLRTAGQLSSIHTRASVRPHLYLIDP